MADLTDFPWSRNPGEMTTVYLARVLDDLCLPEMARRARRGEFDDFQCPADLPWAGLELHQLVSELHDRAKSPRCGFRRRKRIMAMIAKVKEGEFDATKEESDRWAASKEGQEVFKALVEGR